MAKLTKCTDCDHEISKKAKACPSCGAPQKKRTSPVTMLIAIILIPSMIVGIMDGGNRKADRSGANASSSQATAAASPRKPQSNKDMFLANHARAIAWMERDKETVVARLKDPGSAEFENVYISFMKDSPVTCGKVNARNGFGGYTGFQEFIAAKGAGITVIRGDGQMEDSEFVKVWNAACRDPINV